MFLAGAAASEAENRKTNKYSQLLHSHVFIPVAMETLGSFGLGATELVTSLGRRLVEYSVDPRSGFFLKQRIDVAVQRGNVLSALGTFPSAVRSADISFVH